MPNLPVTNITLFTDVSTAGQYLQRSLQTTATKGAQLFGSLNVPPKVPDFNPGFN